MDKTKKTLPYSDIDPEQEKRLNPDMDLERAIDSLQSELIFNPMNNVGVLSQEQELQFLNQQNNQLKSLWSKVSLFKDKVKRAVEERREKNKLVQDPGELF